MSASSVPSVLSVLTPRTIEFLLPTLAISGHGFKVEERPPVDERAAKLARSKLARNRAIGSYLEFHAPAMAAMGFDPLEPESVLDHLHMPRCGLPDVLPARASQCKWGHEPVTVKLGQGWDRLELFTLDEIKSAITWSNNRWCAEGGSVWKWHEPGDPGPNQLVHYVPIDGPSNVLADQVLPCNVRRDTECRMRLDSGEFKAGGLYARYGMPFARAVITHEDGHKWGHDHSRDVKALMYPMARPEQLDLGGDDMERHRLTYGAPKATPVPDPGGGDGPQPPSGDHATYHVKGIYDGRPVPTGGFAGAPVLLDGVVSGVFRRMP